MKKIISIILAISMVLTLIPAVFAAPAEIEVTFNEESAKKIIHGAITSGRYAFELKDNAVVMSMLVRPYNSNVATYDRFNNVHTAYAAIPFTAEASGVYEIQIKSGLMDDYGADVEIFIVEDPGAEGRCQAREGSGCENLNNINEASVCWFLGHNLSNDSVVYSDNYADGCRGRFDFGKAPAGEYAPAIYGSHNATVQLEYGKKYYFILLCDAETGEVAQEDNLDFDTHGENYPIQHFSLSGIKFIPVTEPETPDSVSYFVSDVEGVTAKVSGVEITKGKVQSSDYGATLSLSAKNVGDKIFRYWKTGSADNGSYYSNQPNIDVPLLSNMSFTAIYEDTAKTDTKTVQFFNQNKEFIDEKTTIGTTLPENNFPTATLKGYEFLGWYKSVEDYEAGTKFTASTVLTDPVTRVVARFADEGDSVSKAVKVAKKATSKRAHKKSVEHTYYALTPEESVTYAKGIACIGEDNITAWKRDGRVVSYGKDYTYLAWDIDTDIMSSKQTFAETTPLLVLDKNANGEYMIEYDKNGCTVHEAGILFGSDSSTVDSYLSKAKASELLDHGQFMAAPNGNEGALYTGARGYLVYEDNGVKKIIYANTYMTNN